MSSFQFLAMLLSAVSLLSNLSFSSTTTTLNDRPIIGIISVPVWGMANVGSHIPASYVKMVESGGARVVPVPLGLSQSENDNLFHSLNGLFIPGGDSDPLFYKTMQRFYQQAIDANNAGDYFPIWGTCLGFETLVALASGQNDTVLTPCDGEKVLLPIQPTSNFNSSRLFHKIDPKLASSLFTEPIEPNIHHLCVTPDKFSEPEFKLKDTFKLLATSKTLKGIDFGAALEGHTLPFYAIQWHAEKNVFEWTTQSPLSRSDAGVEIMSYFARFFVNEARKSMHKFANSSADLYRQP